MLARPRTINQAAFIVPFDLVYDAAIHGRTANHVNLRAAKAYPPNVNIANKDSEYAVEKKMVAGLIMNTRETAWAMFSLPLTCAVKSKSANVARVKHAAFNIHAAKARTPS